MSRSAVKSAARTMEILSYFSVRRVPLSQKALCDALGYPQSSATVLLRTLTDMGYVNYDRGHRVYFPTVKLTALGEWIPTALFGQGLIQELMRDLHAATNETVVAAIRNDVYIQYIAVIESSHAIRFHVDPGDMRPVTQSAVGWLLMSKLKDKEVDLLIRRSNIACGRAAGANIDSILESVRQTRSKRFGYAENMPNLGGASIGVLLPLLVQGQPVALCCGGVLERMRKNRSRYLAIIQKVAKSLERSQSD
jgi:DNA-binding IclR family transcriptional regulator